MKDFLLAMSPVFAIWFLLLGPVVYVAARGVVRGLRRTFSAVIDRQAPPAPARPSRARFMVLARTGQRGRRR